MSSERYFDSWTGYNPVLQNGTLQSLQEVERNYDHGEIGGRNTVGLPLEKTVMQDNIMQVDPEKETIEDQRKILYAHPSTVPYPSGLAVSATYAGSSSAVHTGRKVSDSAVLRVEDEPPVENFEDLENVRTFLIGDKQDQGLEGESVKLQPNPFTV